MSRWLVAKPYADSTTVLYGRSPDGKLETRTWARSSGGSHVTTYTYTAATGEMTQVEYSDDTPAVTYTYDRLGRQKTVTDVVGTRTFAYTAYGELLSDTGAGLQW